MSEQQRVLSSFSLATRFSLGKEDKADRGRGGKTTSGKWTGLEFAESQRAMENRENWRKLAVKSSVVPQRPSQLRDERRWRWRSSELQIPLSLNKFVFWAAVNKCSRSEPRSSPITLWMKASMLFWSVLSSFITDCFTKKSRKGRSSKPQHQ